MSAITYETTSYVFRRRPDNTFTIASPEFCMHSFHLRFCARLHIWSAVVAAKQNACIRLHGQNAVDLGHHLGGVPRNMRPTIDKVTTPQVQANHSWPKIFGSKCIDRTLYLRDWTQIANQIHGAPDQCNQVRIFGSQFQMIPKICVKDLMVLLIARREQPASCADHQVVCFHISDIWHFAPPNKPAHDETMRVVQHRQIRHLHGPIIHEQIMKRHITFRIDRPQHAESPARRFSDG